MTRTRLKTSTHSFAQNTLAWLIVILVGAIGSGQSSSVNAQVDTTEPIVIDGDLDEIDWKTLVGKEVSITGDLVIIDTFDLMRRGKVKVARERIFIPTESIDPNDKDPAGTSFEGGNNVKNVVGAQKRNDKASLTLDDTSEKQNIFPPTLFPGLGESVPTVRIGSTVQGVTGKVVKNGRNVMLVSDQPLQWTPQPRPEKPEIGEADVTIASFNVLNYFTTIDNGSNRARGADSKSEFKRQETKIVSAILALDADVVGVMEIENNLAAEERLVAALNETIGKDVFRGCGLPENFAEAPGGDNAIRVGIIYRSDRVETVGEVSMINSIAFDEARTPVVQTFRPKAKDNPFTVIVNHFKSKGGSADDPENKDKGDGQGGFNAARRNQSLAVCDFIDSFQKQMPTARVLVIGDLNAYGQEDPIDAMRSRGLVDLHQQSLTSVDSDEYSFIYRGQSGSLDHAMATSALASDVTGIAIWHINSDEPRSLDYNEEYNPKSLYQADPFRSSDHDPVLIGIKN